MQVTILSRAVWKIAASVMGVNFGDDICDLNDEKVWLWWLYEPCPNGQGRVLDGGVVLLT